MREADVQRLLAGNGSGDEPAMRERMRSLTDGDEKLKRSIRSSRLQSLSASVLQLICAWSPSGASAQSRCRRNMRLHKRHGIHMFSAMLGDRRAMGDVFELRSCTRR